ncbi:MAG: PilZ domain-containing protein [Bdellovibrionales bacterium]|nr:PilZ domain-containing protein [Bdellovibrionales bacterium]
MSSENYVKVSSEVERAELIKQVLRRKLTLSIQTGDKTKFEALPLQMAGDALVVQGAQLLAAEKAVVSFVLDGQPYFFKSEIRVMGNQQAMIPSNKTIYALHRRANFRVQVKEDTEKSDFETSFKNLKIKNLSLGGMKLECMGSLDEVHVGDSLAGILKFQELVDDTTVVIVRFKKESGGQTTLGVEFEKVSSAMRSRVNQFVISACRYDFYSS